MEASSSSIADRAASGEVEVDAQDGLFDVVVEHELLEAALGRRQAAKEKLKSPKKAYEEADAAAKGMIAGLDDVTSFDVDTDEPLTIRVGRFRIRYASVGSRSEPTTRTTISLLGG